MKTTRVKGAAFLVSLSTLSMGCIAPIDDSVAEEEELGDRELGASTAYCASHWNDAPAEFWTTLANASEYMTIVPNWWGYKGSGQAKCMSKIACYESGWAVHGMNGDYRGMYQIDVDYFPIGECSYSEYWNGGKDIHGMSRLARFWQHYAAFRYILGRYGSPCAGWSHEVNYGWW